MRGEGKTDENPFLQEEGSSERASQYRVNTCKARPFRLERVRATGPSKYLKGSSEGPGALFLFLSLF